LKNALALIGNKAQSEGDDSLSIKLLADLRAVWPRDGTGMRMEKAFSASLVADLKRLEDSPWDDQKHLLTQNKLAGFLGPYEIETRSVKIEKKTARGYLYADLKTAFEHYLDEESATGATNQSGQASDAHFEGATESFGSTSKNASGANNDGPGSTGSTSKTWVDGQAGFWTEEI
jgi:hypothetical protein